MSYFCLYFIFIIICYFVIIYGDYSVKQICTGDQHRDGKWVHDTSLREKDKSFYCCGDGDNNENMQIIYNHSERCANVDYMIHHGTVISIFIITIWLNNMS